MDLGPTKENFRKKTTIKCYVSIGIKQKRQSINTHQHIRIILHLWKVLINELLSQKLKDGLAPFKMRQLFFNFNSKSFTHFVFDLKYKLHSNLFSIQDTRFLENKQSKNP